MPMTPDWFVNEGLHAVITENTPRRWQDLQNSVAKILSECGFLVQIEASTRATRGSVSIDVLARGKIEGRDYTVAIECKNWSSAIPQTVVHGFIHVVREIGADIGYIVSKKGFQSGAIESARLTNVRLSSWNEFQDEFEQQWYNEFFCNEIDTLFSNLQDYLEPLTDIREWAHLLPPEDQDLIWKKYHDNFMLSAFLLPFNKYVRHLRHEKIKLPLGSAISKQYGIPEFLASIIAYREFLSKFIDNYYPLLVFFRGLETKARGVTLRL